MQKIHTGRFQLRKWGDSLRSRIKTEFSRKKIGSNRKKVTGGWEKTIMVKFFKFLVLTEEFLLFCVTFAIHFFFYLFPVFLCRLTLRDPTE
jgi:hypothetical protein